MTPRIAIVDYGMGNLFSLRKAFSRLDAEPVIASDSAAIRRSDKIVLPGVGHFGKAMENLHRLNLVESLGEFALIKRKPVLGICLGAQILAKSSEEGGAKGLGWIDGDVLRFKFAKGSAAKIPHIGWNQVTTKKPSELMRDIPETAEFYFVHSYYIHAAEPGDVLAETFYEHPFTSAVSRANIFGVQFHPEKSYENGAALLRNFASL